MKCKCRFFFYLASCKITSEEDNDVTKCETKIKQQQIHFDELNTEQEYLSLAFVCIGFSNNLNYYNHNPSHLNKKNIETRQIRFFVLLEEKKICKISNGTKYAKLIKMQEKFVHYIHRGLGGPRIVLIKIYMAAKNSNRNAIPTKLRHRCERIYHQTINNNGYVVIIDDHFYARLNNLCK